jgi:hypothetical protein
MQPHACSPLVLVVVAALRSPLHCARLPMSPPPYPQRPRPSFCDTHVYPLPHVPPHWTVIELPALPRALHPDARASAGAGRADSVGGFSASSAASTPGGPLGTRTYTAFDYVFSSNLSALQYPSFFAQCRMKVRRCLLCTWSQWWGWTPSVCPSCRSRVCRACACEGVLLCHLHVHGRDVGIARRLLNAGLCPLPGPRVPVRRTFPLTCQILRARPSCSRTRLHAVRGAMLFLEMPLPSRARRDVPVECR